MKAIGQLLDEILVDLAVRCPEIALDECPADLQERVTAAREARKLSTTTTDRPSP